MDRQVARRRFLAGAAAATLTIVKPGSARGAPANSTLELGIMGPGGRGTWLCNLFQQHTQSRVVAAADYFADRVAGARGRFHIPENRCFSGLDGYRRLLETNVEAVAVQTPPYFHPEQCAAAVAAGKHVFVAKPIAVDVPGCQGILQSGRRATANNLVFLVDFQTRANPFYQETVRRVQAGQIGTVVMVQANYHTGRLGPKGPMEGPEGRLRNWHYYIALSGDIIVEQNIHALDVAAWFVNADPIKATGTGGRKVRLEGDCYDHFICTFTFPNDVCVDFSSTQCIQGHGDIGCLVYGARGTAHTHYGGQVLIRGRQSYRGGSTGRIYQEGAVENMRTFHRSIQQRNYTNPTVAPSVRSNLTCILGRQAAYTGHEVTWADLLRANERLDGRLDGLRS